MCCTHVYSMFIAMKHQQTSQMTHQLQIYKHVVPYGGKGESLMTFITPWLWLVKSSQVVFRTGARLGIPPSDRLQSHVEKQAQPIRFSHSGVKVKVLGYWLPGSIRPPGIDLAMIGPNCQQAPMFGRSLNKFENTSNGSCGWISPYHALN